MTLVSEKASELFHYTTVEGFIGICRSNSLWATHWSDLNDRSELRRFELLLVEHLVPILEKGYGEQLQKSETIKSQIKNGRTFRSIIREMASRQAAVFHD